MSVETVLVINSGSSSIKYQLVNPASGEAICTGLVEQIGEAEGGHIHHEYKGKEHDLYEGIPDHGVGMSRVLDLFNEVGPKLDEYDIVSVGHRIVQGGYHFDGPAIATPDVVALIEKLAPLAPLHNPAHLAGLRVAQKLLPDVPHVVVFDTAFFQHLPGEAATYALDKAVAEKYAVRRYGAHGTSHMYVSKEAAKLLGRDDAKLITCHLGNGASISAVDSGRAMDTSMGLTPLEGLVMGTRCGDIDPAVVFHLIRNAGMNVDQVDTLFNKQSGLKGLTGYNDMRAVRKLKEEGDEGAKLALEVYVHRLVKYIGAYTAILGGVDGIVFTAGVGENDAKLRADVVARLGYRGICIDEAANAARSKQPRIISTPGSTAAVMVIPTNEELAIARQAYELVTGHEA